MKEINIFCFGFGQVAKYFIKNLSKKYNINLVTTSRNKTQKKEILNFIQVCPKEMIDKLGNPITLKPMIKEVS